MVGFDRHIHGLVHEPSSRDLGLEGCDQMVATDLGVQHLIIELDVRVTVKLSSDCRLKIFRLIHFLLDCKRLLQSFREVRMCHIYREEARMGWLIVLLDLLVIVMMMAWLFLNIFQLM